MARLASSRIMMNTQHMIHLCILLELFHLPIAMAGSSWNFQKATFVPPAHPIAATRCQASVVGERTIPSKCDTSSSSSRSMRNSFTPLLMSKKKAVAAPVKKIQVKMLKYVEGTGHLGEIVNVTPAFYNNKLRPTSSAVAISDEEVAKERADAQRLQAETNASALALKEQIDNLTLVLHRKAGPDGQLFGGIGPKMIMEELHKLIGDDFLHHKTVKIASLTSEDGSTLRGDIKHTGQFGASLSLTKDISVSFAIQVDTDS